MKTRDELQEAHDFLHGVLVAAEKDNVVLGDKGVEDRIRAAHDAIGWALGCTCGQTFQANYDAMRKELEAAGFKFERFKAFSE